MICKYCGTVNGDSAKFCHGCGKALGQPVQPPQERHCPFCGQPVKEDAVFCRNCGSKISFEEDVLAFDDKPDFAAPRKTNENVYQPMDSPEITEAHPNAVAQVLTDTNNTSGTGSIPVAETMVLDRSLLHETARAQMDDECAESSYDNNEEQYVTDEIEEESDAVYEEIMPPEPAEDPILSALEKSQMETGPDYHIETASKVCPSCGRPLREGIKFCGFCGTPVASNTDDSCDNHDDHDEIQQVSEDAELKSDGTRLPIEELRKLKSLLDDEIITEEEFKTIKKRLLAID